MNSLDPAVAEKMADVARSRAVVWELMSQLFSPPTEEFVEQLRDGSMRRQLEENTAWVGEDNPMIIHLHSLRAFEGRSVRFALDHDVHVLAEEWERLQDRDVSPGLSRWASRTPDLCREEARAWEALDIDTSRAKRLAQFDDLARYLQESVDWAESMHAHTKVLVVRMLMRIFGAHLSIETGRDLLPQIMRPNA